MAAHATRKNETWWQSSWLLLLAIVVFWFVWNASILGTVLFQGELFGPDDYLRLAQIRDFMEGQAWFDVTAYQLSPPDGADIHWTRIVDLPVAGLIAVFSLFFETRLAENIISILWPLSLFVCTVMIWVSISKRLMPGSSGLLVVLLAATSIPSLNQFSAGRLDHHNLQILLFGLAILGLVNRDKRWGNILIGFAPAASIAIGIDIALILAVFFAVIGHEWAFNKDGSKYATTWVGLSLGFFTVVFYSLTVAPMEYWVAYCDANSAFFLAALLCVSTGFSLLGLVKRNNLVTRLALGGGVGILILAFLYWQFPACVTNPLGSLSDELRLRWLSTVVEAKPLSYVLEQFPFHWFATVGYLIGMLMIALVVCLKATANKAKMISLFALLFFCALASILQIRLLRTSIYVAIPFCVICAHLTWQVLKARYPSEGIIRGVFQSTLILLMIPLFWYVLGAIAFPVVPDNAVYKSGFADQYVDQNTSRREETRCQQYDDFAFARSLPSANMMSDLTNSMPAIVHTNHNLVAGPYHRNGDDILASLNFFETTEEEALQVVDTYQLQYVGVCLPQLKANPDDYHLGSVGHAVATETLPKWLELSSPVGDRFRVLKIVPLDGATQ